MSFTRVLGPGIHTASNINSHNINSTGIITAVSFVGDGSGLSGVASTDSIITGTAATFNTYPVDINAGMTVAGVATFSGNLTVGGVLTYEDVKNVDSIGVVTARNGIDCNGDIDVDGHTNLDNVSIAGVTTFSDDVYFDGATADRDIIFDRSANTLQVKRNAILKIGQGSYSTDLYTDGTNTYFDHNQNSALFVKSNIFQVYGTGNGYDGTILRCINGKVELGYEISNGGATTLDNLVTTPIGVTVGTGVTIERNGNSNFVGVSSLGTGATGAVYLYNPDADALSATTNDAYGWKAKTYQHGLQVNSSLYLSRSGSNGLQLSYNNATGSYISALSGFLRVGVPYGNYFNLYANDVYIKNSDQNTTFAHFEKISNSLTQTHLYSQNQIKLSTEPSGISVVGTTTTTQLAVTGVSTFTGNSNFNGDIFFLGASSKTITFDQSEGHIRWLDNAKAQFGTQGDLEIYHNGSHAFIENTGDGYLFLNNTNANIYLRPNSGEDGIIVKTNSSVELYHNNTKTFQTTSFGAETIFTSASGTTSIFKVLHGNLSQGIGIGYHSIHATGSNTDVQLKIMSKGSSDLSIQTSAGENMAIFRPNESAYLYYDSSLKFKTTSTGAKVNGKLGVGVDSPTSELEVQGANHTNLRVLSGNSDNIGFFQAVQSADLRIGTSTNTPVKLFVNGVDRVHLDTSGNLNIPNDSGKFQAGASQDLKIYHDGNHSYVDNSTGLLILQDTSGIYIRTDDLRLQSAGGSETYATLTKDGAVALNFDNSQKFTTTTSGVTITGSINATGGQLTLENGNEEQIHRFWTNSSDSDIYGLLSGSVFGTIVEGANNGHHVIALRDNDTNDSFAIVSGGGNYQTDSTYDTLVARFYSNGVFYMPDNNRIKLGTGNDIQLYHDGSNSYLDNTGGVLHFRSVDDIKLQTNTSELAIKCDANGAVELYHNGNRQVFTIDGGMNWQDNKKAEFGNSGDLKIYHDGSENVIDCSNSHNLEIRNGSERLAEFGPNGAVDLYYDNSQRFQTTSAGITVTGTVDSASDVILKENIKTIDNALDKVTKLRGVEYDYKENKKHSIGVIAQEVEEVLPELVNGSEQKSVAYGNIAAVLIEAIKEQNEIINKMKKEIEDLKG